MNKVLLVVAVCGGVFAMTAPLYAQNGCVNSPENPTAILAIVGSAGAFFVSARARIKARRKS
jgi:XrtJ-associated TM-motif-TM protein